MSKRVVVPLVVCLAFQVAATVWARAGGTPATSTLLGGPVAYRAVAIQSAADLTATTSPDGFGPVVRLAAHAVPSPAREPALAVSKAGDVFYDAKGSGPGCLHQIGGCTGPGTNVIYRSTDEGRTWTDVSGPVEDTLFSTAADPDVEVDADTGRVFWASIASPRPAMFAFSTDNGTSWTTTQAYAPYQNDHETIVAGRVPAGSTLTPSDPTFPKIVYYCTNSSEFVSCARSLDGGLTFLPTKGQPLSDESAAGCGAETGFMSTDNDGRVFIGGADCGTPEISVSADAGDSWSNVVVNSLIPAEGHDVEVAPDAGGNVYALWLGTTGLPYLSVSRDHGHTFGPALLVSAPGVHEAGFLALAAGDEGRVVVSYVGTMSSDRGDAYRPWNYYVAISTDALDEAPRFESNVAPDHFGNPMIVNRGDCCPGMWDYLDVDAAPSAPGAAWASLSRVCSDTCGSETQGQDDLWPGQGYAIEQIAGPALRGDRATFRPPP